MDAASFADWTQELRAFTRDTAARLAAHEEWKQRHDATLQDMRAQHDDQMRGIRQIMSHIATHMVEHEGRLSQNERTFEAIATTLKAINAKL